MLQKCVLNVITSVVYFLTDQQTVWISFVILETIENVLTANILIGANLCCIRQDAFPLDISQPH